MTGLMTWAEFGATAWGARGQMASASL